MISIKTKKDIETLKKGGFLLGGVLRELSLMVKPGITTLELEERACALIGEIGGRPSFKGYRPGGAGKRFPTALCTSINEEVVHAPAVPARVLVSGDVVGIDVGMEYDGLFTDMALTVGVGVVSGGVKKLLKVTKSALMKGIEQMRPGNKLSDIGRAIQLHAEGNGFSVVRDLVGHGVGYAVHEDPNVPNYVNRDLLKNDVVLKEGMVLALEPMICSGKFHVETLRDGFSVVTKDRSLAAQFEHTVAVVEGGYLILTGVPEGA